MCLPQVNIGMEGLLTSTAPGASISVCGSLAIGYQFLPRDGLYLCRLYSMYLRVHGASMCVIMDSRALSRKSSTVTIFEKVDLSFIDQDEHKEVLWTTKDVGLQYLMVKFKEKNNFPNFLATFVRSTNDAKHAC